MFLRALITMIFAGSVGALIAGYIAVKDPGILGIDKDTAAPGALIVTASVREVIEPEDCEKLVVVPPVFTDQTLRIVIKQNAEELQVVPATYRTVQETITVTPEHREGDTLEHAEVTVVVAEPSEALQTVPATYERRIQRLMTVEPHLLHHLSQDGTVKVMHHPGEFAEISIVSIDTPASVRRVAIPGQTATVTVQRMTVSNNTGKVVPAITRTITRRVLDTPATVRVITAAEDVAYNFTVRMIQIPSSVERIAQPCN